MTQHAPATAQFAETVAPVLEKRCAVCHGCYDSPCQLDLGSFAGLERGATKSPVYDSSRVTRAAPTRLGIDARDEAGWRARGFGSVVRGGQARALLPRMLALGAAHQWRDERLPQTFPLDITRELTCPTADEMSVYERDQPHGGMPYGMARLTDAELGAISSWLAAGAPPPLTPAPPPPEVQAQAARVEAFLNGESLERQLVARYLYEHWFLSHLYFESHPTGPFFRVERSRTQSPEAPDEIATDRPYDDPGVTRPFYRLVPVEGALLHKTHITYALGPEKLRRLESLFFTGGWKATRLPPWGAETGSNPFKTFVELPARARYQFLLDDARHFVMSFIRGPVCHGQVAVDVIQDRFFVAFLDPGHDVSVMNRDFLPSVADSLNLPAEHESEYVPGQLFIEYNREQTAYLDARAKAYAERDPKLRGPALDWIWNGGGKDPDALLTVFRHFDSAAVTRGFVGTWPKTAWIMDYPIFERLYYDLVAGFDVFGNVTHQVSTRLYMDHLRMQSEDVFLAFLPADRREPLRVSWYQGATRQVSYFLTDRLRNEKRGTQIRYATKDPKAELLAKILARAGAAGGPPDSVNRCAGKACDTPGIERSLRRLVGGRGPWVALLPDLSLLRVRGAGTWSLVRDQAHTNVAFMFREESRRVPDEDEVTVAPGIAGSYPNFVFDVTRDEVEAFVDSVLAIRNPAGLDRVATRFGLRRTSPRFWRTIDEIQAEYRAAEPTESALLDLNRYGNF